MRFLKEWRLISCCGLLLGIALRGRAQELYVFSEPASSMPAKSIDAKMHYRFADGKQRNGSRISPEIMLGLDRKWMLKSVASLSDFYSTSLRFESIRAYGKYRFYSQDEVHSHFRLAAYAEAAWTRSPFQFGELSLDGDNSGIQAGVIATKLVSRVAVSATAGAITVFADRAYHRKVLDHPTTAFQYSLSAGMLLLPFNYTSYRQTNLNLYLEAIGMNGLDKSDHMLDLAPALQLIFLSTTKLNFGARFQVSGSMERFSNRSYFVSVEQSFLGALRKRRPVKKTVR